MRAGPRSRSGGWPRSVPKAPSPLRPEILEGKRDKEQPEARAFPQGVPRRTTPRLELARVRREEEEEEEQGVVEEEEEEEGDRVVRQGVAAAVVVAVEAMLVMGVLLSALRREAIAPTAEGMVTQTMVLIVLAPAAMELALLGRRFQVSFEGMRGDGLGWFSVWISKVSQLWFFCKRCE